MARYEAGFSTAGATTAAALLSMRATTVPAIIYEIGFAQPGTGTPTVVAGILGKAANSGSVVATTSVNGYRAIDITTASNGTVQSAWSTPPTAPTLILRKFSLPATLGATLIWTFPAGLWVPVGSDLTLWNNGGTTSLVLVGWVSFEE